jgi:hypothetical protein
MKVIYTKREQIQDMVRDATEGDKCSQQTRE